MELSINITENDMSIVKKLASDKNISVTEYVRQLLSNEIYNHTSGKSIASQRIGVAKGKFEVPDDLHFMDDEIADMFEGKI